MIAGLFMVFLIAAHVVVAVAGQWTRTAGIRQQRAETTWRQVPATVAVSAPAHRDGSSGPVNTVWKPARWTAPDGRPRSGWIRVSPGAAASSTVRVWVHRSGALTGWPLQPAQLRGRIALVGVLTVIVLGLVLCAIGGAGRFLFDQRRLADWDKAWRAVGPRSTRQL